MTLYTSLETSLALRDAGAPQEGSQRKPRWCPANRKHGHVEVQMSNYPKNERAFRADEIVEALGKRLAGIMPRTDGSFAVSIWEAGYYAREVRGASFVEALAAAYLVMLRGAE